ncbi:acyl--CoA ligase [Nocardia sp. NBC_00565]|uniref:class I adenylate-forming enzyme family protein n=1 Tax=Nocardia sp. NBC_00565 TaxID=2975993 RepID=UPI002E8159D7|nr:class I adenylate-forming enzyme family protein [Nocardia sp. NBC_00565]WUC05659.1 acyl--CoA ligase [Nocardia sp. NBC_00565]
MTISLLLDMSVSGHPDRTAITSGAESLTYQQFADLVQSTGTALRQSGAKNLVYLGGSGLELPALLFGAAYAGIPFIPINYRLDGARLVQLINRVGNALVVAAPRYAESVAAADATVETTDAFFARARKAAPEPLPAAEADPEGPAVLLFTSGTTAEPKAVVLRHSHLLSYVMGTVEFGSADSSDGALITVPPYHVAGIGTILTNVYAGRRMIYLPDFDAAEWLRLVRDEAATSAMVVPTMLDRIVTALDGNTADVPSLRSLSYGGARMPRPTLEAALRAFPDTGFVNAYGLTETSSTIALLGPEDHRAALDSDDPGVRARLGAIGRPVPDIEIDIRGVDEKPVGTGEHGELWVRGPQVSGEYMGSGSVLDAQGWFPTRDLAYQDSEGFVFIVGRNDDTIIRGGENIAPAEIEDVLVQHPAVRSVAVVGIPDEHWGQAILAAVVLDGDTNPSSDQLCEFVRSRLRSSRTPDRLIFRTELPATPTGKILRKEIAADYLAEVSGSAIGLTSPGKE